MIKHLVLETEKLMANNNISFMAGNIFFIFGAKYFFLLPFCAHYKLQQNNFVLFSKIFLRNFIERFLVHICYVYFLRFFFKFQIDYTDIVENVMTVTHYVWNDMSISK